MFGRMSSIQYIRIVLQVLHVSHASHGGVLLPTSAPAVCSCYLLAFLLFLRLISPKKTVFGCFGVSRLTGDNTPTMCGRPDSPANVVASLASSPSTPLAPLLEIRGVVGARTK